jgi:hypothetical protein
MEKKMFFSFYIHLTMKDFFVTHVDVDGRGDEKIK